VNEVINTSLRIRTLFIAAKTKQLGRVYKPSPKQDKEEFWIKAATKCELLGCTPEQFIKCVFGYGVGKDSGGPYITQLYSNAVDIAFKKFCGDNNIHEVEEESFMDELTSARDQLLCGMKFRGMTPEEFLLQDIIPIRPIVKLFLQQNSKRIWRKYIDDAKKELLNDQSLEEALKRLKFDIEKVYEFNKYN